MSRKQLLISLCLLACVACASVAYAQTAATRPARQDDGARAFSMILGGDNFLGVYTEQVTRENMSRYSLSGEPRGVAVTEVAENSPAAKAGLQKDDVILRFDGEAVGSTQKLSRLINESAPEHTARLTVSRGGSEREITVTLGKRELATTREGMMFNNGELFRLNQGEWQKQSAEEARKQAEEWQKHSEEWKKQTEQLRQQLEKMPRPENFSFVLGAGRRIGVTTTALTDQLADYFGVSHDGGVLITSVTEGGRCYYGSRRREDRERRRANTRHRSQGRGRRDAHGRARAQPSHVQGDAGESAGRLDVDDPGRTLRCAGNRHDHTSLQRRAPGDHRRAATACAASQSCAAARAFADDASARATRRARPRASARATYGTLRGV
jgi:hypothetical protein